MHVGGMEQAANWRQEYGEKNNYNSTDSNIPRVDYILSLSNLNWKFNNKCLFCHSPEQLMLSELQSFAALQHLLISEKLDFKISVIFIFSSLPYNSLPITFCPLCFTSCFYTFSDRRFLFLLFYDAPFLSSSLSLNQTVVTL